MSVILHSKLIKWRSKGLKNCQLNILNITAECWKCQLTRHLMSSWKFREDRSDCTVASETFCPSNLHIQQNQQYICTWKRATNSVKTDSHSLTGNHADCSYQSTVLLAAARRHPTVKMLVGTSRPKASVRHIRRGALCILQKQLQYPYKITAVITSAETNSYVGLWAPDRGPAVCRRHRNLHAPRSSLGSCLRSPMRGESRTPLLTRHKCSSTCVVQLIRCVQRTTRERGFEGFAWGGRRFG